ncbi:Uncharacterised protein [Brevundimonas diminuta]|jgi:hypothetical protein|uniref:hypothetical protein n=1 Tax=Brevundimonas diminuta TaxID=293 RepID=UPI000207EC05|nr:hypothetical protein [Brevundimonas diminuta]EGF94338.1 hypothetical protein BDIM_11580 [Brevundimonas diminuta ATCC 11568]OWR17529.1 hypothetical protein CD944_13350 [Brevundimonas diminuta]WQE43688.1 hypothetical protein U0020_08680 [Brevundimonas diminuta]SPU47619.1 Uncharacterised protein [Brevundimonas diminuta]SUW16166.1 Uncharacterised protein [Brevundimonas diminuta]
MIAQIFALALSASMPLDQAPAQANSSAEDQAVRLEDIQVSGRRLDALIENFVSEVAAPNRGRGIARWDRSVCVGAVNLRREAAQYLVDRVSTVAEDLGLNTGDPGCTPNLLIVATTDGDAFAQELVERRRRALRMGGSGMDRGAAALRDFQETSRPVRWWQVSMPVDSETGQRAVRIPGECTNDCSGPMDYAPVINVSSASRLTTQIVDNIFRAIIVVDISKTGAINSLQLADYVTMVSLAQIDPTADTSAYASILNVFDDPDSAPHLTEWDKAYLHGLYGAERTRQNVRAGKSEIQSSIRRAHARLADEAPTTTD